MLVCWVWVIVVTNQKTNSNKCAVSVQVNSEQGFVLWQCSLLQALFVVMFLFTAGICHVYCWNLCLSWCSFLLLEPPLWCSCSLLGGGCCVLLLHLHASLCSVMCDCFSGVCDCFSDVCDCFSDVWLYSLICDCFSNVWLCSLICDCFSDVCDCFSDVWLCSLMHDCFSVVTVSVMCGCVHWCMTVSVICDCVHWCMTVWCVTVHWCVTVSVPFLVAIILLYAMSAFMLLLPLEPIEDFIDVSCHPFVWGWF